MIEIWSLFFGLLVLNLILTIWILLQKRNSLINLLLIARLLKNEEFENEILEELKEELKTEMKKQIKLAVRRWLRSQF